MSAARRIRRGALWAGSGLGVVLALGVRAVLILTNTPWGRDRVRGIVVQQVAEVVEGEVEVAALTGNLLGRFALEGVRLRDREGRPFVEAREVGVAYDLRGLLRRRVILTELILRDPEVVLDQPPGEEWNFLRIFPTDQEADPDLPGEGAWGSWVELRNVTLENGRVMIRTEWEPDPELPAPAREELRREALAGEGLPILEEVPGGVQQVMGFHPDRASIPRITVAHPEVAAPSVEVASMEGRAQLFRAPPAEILELSGELDASGEALVLEGVELALPGSRLWADARLDPETGELEARLSARPLSLPDLRFVQPDLPDEVEGELEGWVRLEAPAFHARIDEVDLRVGGGRVVGHAEVAMDGFLEHLASDLRFSDLDTRFLEEFVPELPVDRHAALGGHVVAAPLAEGAAADGSSPPALQLDLFLDVVPEGGLRSRILAEGALRLSPEPEDTELTGFVVETDPLHWDAVTALVPEAPGAGRVEGRAVLDGTLSGVLQLRSDWALVQPGVGDARVATDGGLSLAEGLAFHGFGVTLEATEIPVLEAFAGEIPMEGAVAGAIRLDGPMERGMEFAAHLEHLHGEGDSRFEARGELATAGGPEGWVEAELLPLSLGALGGEGGLVPALEPGARVRGRLEARGTPEDLRAEAELALSGEGWIRGGGRLDRRGAEPVFEGSVALQGINLAALTRITGEETALRGTLEGSGRGMDLRSAMARLRVEVEDDRSPGPRLLDADLALEEGLVEFRPLTLRLPATRIQAEGGLGLVEDRVGTLQYQVEVDSLSALAPFLPEPEPGIVEPQPLVRGAAADARRRQLLEGARARQVEYLATGEVPEPPPPPDTLLLVGIHRDALRGWVRAEGTLQGHLGVLEGEGAIRAEELLVAGHRLDRALVEHAVEGLGTPNPEASLMARVEGLLVAGLVYEQLEVEADYRGEPVEGEEAEEERLHSGDLSLRLRQDPGTRLATGLRWEVQEGVASARLDDLLVVLPEAELRTSEPATFLWDPQGLEVRDFRLWEFARLPGPLEEAAVEEPEAPPPGEPLREGDRPGRMGDDPPRPVLTVDGHLPREGEGALDVRVQGFEIGHVLELLRIRDDLRARVELDLPLRGSLTSPEVEAELGVRQLRFQDRSLPEARVAAQYREREAELDGELLDRETGERVLLLEGRFPVDLTVLGDPEDRLLPGPIEARIRLDSMDLGVLATLVEGLESTAGVAEGDIRLTGTFQEPALDGALRAELPTAYVEPLGVRFQDAAASLSFDGGTVQVDSLVAWSRGPIRVEGRVGVPGMAEPEVDLRLEARNSRIMDTRELSLQVDADLEASGPFEGLQLAGLVRARRGVIRIPETEELADPGPLDLADPATFARIEDARLLALRDALIETSPFLEELELALEVHVDREVWLRSQEANIELRTLPEVGPLRVEMTGIDPRNLRLDGTIGSDRGEYAFMGRRFDLSRASIIFTPETTFDPLIRLVAEHEVHMAGREGFDIRIIVDGSLTELDTELESTAQPPLSETDLLSFMVFGREAGSLLRSQGSGLTGQGSAGGPLVGAVAARAAQSFAAVGMDALVAELEAEVARALGLDVIHIVPADLPTELSTGELGDLLRGTEVEAGAYLTPRLFVSGQARPTFVHPGARVDYQTEHGWVVRSTLRPRFLPSVPTLSEVRPDRASVLGFLILREWRF